MMVPRYVAVVGQAQADAQWLELAHDVGAALATAGAIVLTGGLGGVMAAASRGASESGGTVVGVLPGTDRTAANPHLTIALPTGLGQLRNGVLVTASDALIGIGTSWGTLNEISLALRTGTPVAWLEGQPVAGLTPAPTYVTSVAEAVRLAVAGGDSAARQPGDS
jgi:uncharacterized protein (TIGR00725 family)